MEPAGLMVNQHDAVSAEIIVRGVICRKDKILLVKEVGSTWWFLPGGHLEAGENLSHCLKRELIEEAQLELTDLRGLGFVENSYTDDSGRRHHEVNVLIQAEPLGEIGAVEDQLEFGWFPLATLPTLDIRPQVIVEILQRGGPVGWLISEPA